MIAGRWAWRVPSPGCIKKTKDSRRKASKEEGGGGGEGKELIKHLVNLTMWLIVFKRVFN